MTTEEYNYLLGLEFGKKLARTVTQMMKFNRDYNGYVSMSGGRGSTVLADINRRFGIDMPVVCVPSCEEPENVKVALRYNAIFVNGTLSLKQIIDKYGYPVISKLVAMKVSRHNRTKTADQKNKRWHGIGPNGESWAAGKIPIKYRFFVYAPFEISEQCCTYRKKNPLKTWAKQNNKLPVTGEMAIESEERKRHYKKHGCIQPGKKCTPMGNWLEDDLDMYIEIYGLKISESYDDPNCDRTGCPECGFGILKDLQRYMRVKKVRPNTYNYIMGGGQYVEKNTYRWVSFTPGDTPVWSNKYWVPSKEGLGIRFVMDYISRALNVNINTEK